jgi:hypothetical protein
MEDEHSIPVSGDWGDLTIEAGTCVRCHMPIQGMAVCVPGVGSFHEDCYDRGLTLWEKIRSLRLSLRSRIWWMLHGRRF